MLVVLSYIIPQVRQLGKNCILVDAGVAEACGDAAKANQHPRVTMANQARLSRGVRTETRMWSGDHSKISLTHVHMTQLATQFNPLSILQSNFVCERQQDVAQVPSINNKSVLTMKQSSIQRR